MNNSNKLFSLAGKKIIVTGSNRGNGLAIAEGIIESGGEVIRVDKEFNIETKSHDYKFDLEKYQLIPDLVEKIYLDHKKIDGLVNNAGISLSSDSNHYDWELHNKTISVNLNAALSLCSVLCKKMSKNNAGAIVNITSLSANLGFLGNPAYQASKAGLKQLTKSLAREWGEYEIRVNSICPGYIRTKMTERSFSDSKLNQQRVDRMILKRWGEPSDLVGASVFLLSDASSYITASEIVVDGGWTSNGM